MDVTTTTANLWTHIDPEGAPPGYEPRARSDDRFAYIEARDGRTARVPLEQLHELVRAQERLRLAGALIDEWRKQLQSREAQP